MNEAIRLVILLANGYAGGIATYQFFFWLHHEKNNGGFWNIPLMRLGIAISAGSGAYFRAQSLIASAPLEARDFINLAVTSVFIAAMLLSTRLKFLEAA